MIRTSIDKIKENSFKLTKERSRRYPAYTITDVNYANDIALLANAHAQAETLLRSLEWAAANIGLHVNAHKTEYMCFNQTGDISTLNGSSLKLVDKFPYLGSSVLSTETDINMWLAKYGCTTWMLTKWIEKKLDGNYTRMLWAILNKSWRQHPTKQQLYSQLPPITKTIKVRWTSHMGHCWRSRDELISEYSCGPLHMDKQRQDNQLEPTYSSTEPIWDVTLKTFRKQWTIGRGGERGSGISVLIAWHDDDAYPQKPLKPRCLKHLSIKSKKTVLSWQKKEAEDTPHIQLQTWTTPMT